MGKEIERLRTPDADNAIDIFMRDVVGSKSDAAAAGDVTTTDTLVAYIKQLVTASGSSTSLPTTVGIKDAVTNAYSRDVIGNKTDTAATGAVSNTESLMAYLKQAITLAIARDTAIGTAQSDLDILTGATGVNLLTATQTSIDAIETDTGTTLPATLATLPQCAVKTDGAVLSGVDPLFTISGGPVRAKIVGLVTTLIGGAANGRLQHITTTPAATVELNTGAVAIDNDAVGTFYTSIGSTSVFTPSTGLGYSLNDPVTKEEVEFLLAPGVVQFLSSAAQDGVIAWYMSFAPLSPLSTVTVAA